MSGRLLKTGVMIRILILLVGCAKHISYTQAMRKKIAEFEPIANAQLKPYFQRTHVKFPPNDIALLIFKRSRRIELYAKQNTPHWVYIRTYPVLAASGGLGPKLHSGDRQVPEGVYQIVGLNPVSRFDLSMQLNYPNSFDRYYADVDQRANLGGNIFIHGNKYSVGCIAIGDVAIQQLFPLVYEVGAHHVKVIIAPNDLRTHAAAFGRTRPKWLPILYLNLRDELKSFPSPRF